MKYQGFRDLREDGDRLDGNPLLEERLTLPDISTFTVRHVTQNNKVVMTRGGDLQL